MLNLEERLRKLAEVVVNCDIELLKEQCRFVEATRDQIQEELEEESLSPENVEGLTYDVGLADGLIELLDQLIILLEV